MAETKTQTTPLDEIKRGQMFVVDKLLGVTAGYRLSKGVHMIIENSGQTLVNRPNDQVYGSLRTLHIDSGLSQTLYPLQRELHMVPLGEGVGVYQEKIRQLQIKTPGNFASFGAEMSLGTDPEVFVVDSAGDVLPAFNVFNDKAASVKEGWQSTSYHTKCAKRPYWDGFQAEFEVQPYQCIAHLTDCIQHGLAMTYRKAVQYDPKARLTGMSVLPVPAKALQEGAEEHVQLGCLPSLNTYGHTGVKPGNGRHLPIRFAGFHLHFELAQHQLKMVDAIVRMIDKVCGVLSVATLAGMEDPIRRRYYGLAGEYRLPKHGLEWRVLSSAVLWHPALVHLHFNMARCAVQLATKGLDCLWLGSDEEAAQCVDTLDVDAAKRILTDNRDLMIGCLQDTYHFNSPSAAPLAFDNFILGGMKDHIELDMEKNWYLKTPATWRGHSGIVGCQFNSFVGDRLGKLKLISQTISNNITGRY